MTEQDTNRTEIKRIRHRDGEGNYTTLAWVHEQTSPKSGKVYQTETLDLQALQKLLGVDNLVTAHGNRYLTAYVNDPFEQRDQSHTDKVQQRRQDAANEMQY